MLKKRAEIVTAVAVVNVLLNANCAAVRQPPETPANGVVTIATYPTMTDPDPQLLVPVEPHSLNTQPNVTIPVYFPQPAKAFPPS